MQDNRIKQAPFYVGQRVVCIEEPKRKLSINDGLPYEIRKNCVYRVKDCYQDDLGDWGVRIVGIRHSYVVQYFAPYEPPAIEIPEVLLKEPVEERLDVKVEEVV